MHPRVVVAVADDALRHEALTYCRYLASTNAVEASDGPAAERAFESSFDLLILDADLPGITTDDLLERLAGRADGRRRVVLFTSRPPASARQSLVIDTLTKPVRIESLLQSLDRWRDAMSTLPLPDRHAPTQPSTPR